MQLYATFELLNKMNIYNFSTIKKFSTNHADVKTQLDSWYKVTKVAIWLKPQDIKKTFSKFSILKNNRIRFEIGDSYRLIAELNYEFGWLFIKFIGSHAEYDAIDANTVEEY
jgi:mRNA interferase HigB